MKTDEEKKRFQVNLQFCVGLHPQPSWAACGLRAILTIDQTKYCGCPTRSIDHTAGWTPLQYAYLHCLLLLYMAFAFKLKSCMHVLGSPVSSFKHQNFIKCCTIITCFECSCKRFYKLYQLSKISKNIYNPFLQGFLDILKNFIMCLITYTTTSLRGISRDGRRLALGW